jgi:hypothetical protein
LGYTCEGDRCAFQFVGFLIFSDYVKICKSEQVGSHSRARNFVGKDSGEYIHHEEKFTTFVLVSTLQLVFQQVNVLIVRQAFRGLPVRDSERKHLASVYQHLPRFLLQATLVQHDVECAFHG